jgi:hypothetical protein
MGAKGRAALVEEVEIEGEAHAKGMDAGAAGDKQASAGRVAIEMGEAEQADAQAAGEANVATQGSGSRQGLQARGEATRWHAELRPGAAKLSP